MTFFRTQFDALELECPVLALRTAKNASRCSADHAEQPSDEREMRPVFQMVRVLEKRYYEEHWA